MNASIVLRCVCLRWEVSRSGREGVGRSCSSSDGRMRARRCACSLVCIFFLAFLHLLLFSLCDVFCFVSPVCVWLPSLQGLSQGAVGGVMSLRAVGVGRCLCVKSHHGLPGSGHSKAGSVCVCVCLVFLFFVLCCMLGSPLLVMLPRLWPSPCPLLLLDAF